MISIADPEFSGIMNDLGPSPLVNGRYTTLGEIITSRVQVVADDPITRLVMVNGTNLNDIFTLSSCREGTTSS